METLHVVQSDIRDSFATTFQVGTTLSNRQCKPEKKNGQEKSFAALLAGMVDRDVISMVDTPHTGDKRRMENLTSWLLKKCGNYRSVIPDETKSRAVFRQAVRQANGPEQSRRTHHPEPSRRVNSKSQYSMFKTFEILNFGH